MTKAPDLTIDSRGIFGFSGIFASVRDEFYLRASENTDELSKIGLAYRFWLSVFGVNGLRVASLSPGERIRFLIATGIAAGLKRISCDSIDALDPDFRRYFLSAKPQFERIFDVCISENHSSSLRVSPTFLLGEASSLGGGSFLEATDFSITLGDSELFEKATFKLVRGGLNLVMGANGVGKTTLGKYLSAMSWKEAMPAFRHSGQVSAEGRLAFIGIELEEYAALTVNLGSDEVESAWPFPALCKSIRSEAANLQAGARSRYLFAAILEAIRNGASGFYIDEPFISLDNRERSAVDRVLLCLLGQGLTVALALNEDSAGFVNTVRLRRRTESLPCSGVVWNDETTKGWCDRWMFFSAFWESQVYPMLREHVKGRFCTPSVFNLVDVGCGIGAHTIGVAGLLREVGLPVGEVVGLDRSPLAIEFANGIFSRESSRFVVCDVCSSSDLAVDFGDARPVFVTSLFSLHDLESLQGLDGLVSRLNECSLLGVMIDPEWVSVERSNSTLHSAAAEPVLHMKVAPDGFTVPYFHRDRGQIEAWMRARWSDVRIDRRLCKDPDGTAVGILVFSCV